MFTGLSAQAYALRLRDNNGCIATPLNYTLTEPPVLVVSVVKKMDTSCGVANGTAEVAASGGVGNYQYTWYDTGGNPINETMIATNLSSGDYSVIIEDDNGCNANVAVIINDSDGPKITQQLLKD